MVPRLLTISVLPIFSSLKCLLFSASCSLAVLLLSGFFCTFLFGDFLSVILIHIGAISPLFVYISDLIVYGETSSVLCEADVSIIPVVRAGQIMLS